LVFSAGSADLAGRAALKSLQWGRSEGVGEDRWAAETETPEKYLSIHLTIVQGVMDT